MDNGEQLAEVGRGMDAVQQLLRETLPAECFESRESAAAWICGRCGVSEWAADTVLEQQLFQLLGLPARTRP